MSLVELRFGPHAEHVRTVRLVVVSVARRAGVAEELMDEVRLAVAEACAMAVDRAGGADVVVEVDDDGPRGERLQVSVRGVGAVATDVSAGDLAGVLAGLSANDAEEGLSGGLERALLEGLVDDFAVRVREDGSGTEAVMGWPRTPAPAGRSGTV